MQLAAIRVDDDADDHDLHPDHDGGERDVALDAAALALGNTCRPSDPPDARRVRGADRARGRAAALRRLARRAARVVNQAPLRSAGMPRMPMDD
jgi:hypothetical protein